MAYVRRQSWVVWLALGVIAGLLAAVIWPSAPLHAVATDRSENFVITTGIIEEGIEAIFVLDSLSGTLRGAVISNQTSGFQSMWEANVAADLAKSVATLNVKINAGNAGLVKKGLPARPEVQVPQNPRFTMVTGLIDMRRGAARLRPSRSAIYVAEATTGVVLVYVAPWSPEQHSSDTPFARPLLLWTAEQFATTVVRAE